MDSDLPKVLLEVAGRPMLHWVVDACCAAGVARCIVVIGYEGHLVRQLMAPLGACEFVEQSEQLGTGHAVQMAQPLFAGEDRRDVFVLAGDGPLIRADTLATLLATHRTTGAAATLATAKLDDPTGYGRVVRDGDGSFAAIVEQKDASDEQLRINEINPSYYCFASDLLFEALVRVGNNNRQGEFYLTDVPGLLKGDGHVVSVVDAVPTDDVLSINDPAQLEQVGQILRARMESEPAPMRQRA